RDLHRLRERRRDPGVARVLRGAASREGSGLPRETALVRSRAKRRPLAAMKTLRTLARAMAGHVAVAALCSVGTGEAADAIDARSFRCITSMTPVRHFYVDNLRGDLSGTLAAANAPKGALYPPGSVIQLVPGEVMVKRDKGFNPATRDWEFFEL